MKFSLTEHDATRLAVAAETERTGPRTVRLVSQLEALQGRVVDQAVSAGRLKKML